MDVELLVDLGCEVAVGFAGVRRAKEREALGIDPFGGERNATQLKAATHLHQLIDADMPKRKIDRYCLGNTRRVAVTYKLTAPAGGSTAIVHYLAQRPGATGRDARALVDLYYKRSRLADPTISEEQGKLVANFSAGAAGEDAPAAPALARLDELAEAANIVRQEKDVLALDAETRLVGEVSGGDFDLETSFGNTRVAFADVAGVAGGAGIERPIRIFLRDGEVLAGAVRSAGWSIQAEAGLKFDLDFAHIHLLVLRKSERDGTPAPGHPVLVTTLRGECLAVAGGADSQFEAASPWWISITSKTARRKSTSTW